jgi:flagellar basal body-associated protein FliL
MSPAMPRMDEQRFSKVPIVLIVLSIIMAGGFFGMKARAVGISKQPVTLAQGEQAVIELDEKLVNLADKRTYMRATLAFHLRSGFDPELAQNEMAALDDAVIRILGDKLPDEVVGSQNLKKVKRELAKAMNSILAPKQPRPVVDGKEHPDWDSEYGPVLKVYFRALAIQ